MTASAALAGIAGCGDSAQHPATPATATTASAATTSAATTPGRSATPEGVAARCGTAGRADVRVRALPGVGSARMPVVEIGRGSTVAVFLHQTDGDGLCGFWPYASWLTEHYPVRAVLFDLCGYGRARCPDPAFSDNQRLQVAAAVRFARAAAPTRVVLVGASMGGALALASTAPTHADAVVDLSGPADWPDAAAAPAAATLRVPALVAVSPGDSDASYPDLRAAFAGIKAVPKKFVSGDGAHGWDLLAEPGSQPPHWRPLATTVAQWITGHYS